MSKLTQSPAWQALINHQRDVASVHMNDLFAADPARFDTYNVKLDGMVFDYSKNRLTAQTLTLLMDLAQACDVAGARDRMFAGEPINNTEGRAVLHTALRRPVTDTVMVDGQNVMPYVQTCLTQMKLFSDRVRSGDWRGHTGAAITDVVNIGIGGSDLGPVMVCEALRPYMNGPRVHFVSNVDGQHLHQTLRDLNPATTLFLIASKTFTTQETMANAGAAKEWVLAAMPDAGAIAKHFVALSTNEAAVTAFGIDPANMFPFRDWVGGRYSIWSSIGLSVAIGAGFDHFRAFLDGAYAADTHFRTAPLDRNIPVLMALIGVWYRNFFGASTQAILPYDQRLSRFPAYLQQLDMESNGKSVDRDGQPVDYATGPIVFGEPGTNGQHSFYQLIHQGTHLIPCDFMAFITPDHPYPDHHRKLLANALAQPQALMMGQTLAGAKGDPFRVFAGNTPSNFMLFDRLTPHALGMLVALYEHKVFVQGVIWNLNSFDQPGVELGKVLANGLLSGWEDGLATDTSTAGLMAMMKTGRVR